MSQHGAAARNAPTIGQWAPDPSGRHQWRWYDREWTAHVADGGVEGFDPFPRVAPEPQAATARPAAAAIATLTSEGRLRRRRSRTGVWLGGAATLVVGSVVAIAASGGAGQDAATTSASEPGTTRTAQVSADKDATSPSPNPPATRSTTARAVSSPTTVAGPASKPTTRAPKVVVTVTPASTVKAAPKVTVKATLKAAVKPIPEVTVKNTPNPPAVAPVDPGVPVFANCKQLNLVYPHGVGLPNAVDHTQSGTPGVTTFVVDAAVYDANPGRDGDHDGVACEKR